MRQHRWGTPLSHIALALGLLGALALGALALAPHTSLAARAAGTANHAETHPFTLTSPTFNDGARLPTSAAFNQFGCPGQNIAPTLKWKGVPAGTLSFAFALNDYDAPVAGGFHHWVVYNIPGDVRSMDGNSPFTQGTNDFGLVGYGGPCPPGDGQIHHYVFTLYALTVAQISGTALTYDQLIQAIAPDVNGATVIIGTFSIG